MPKKMASLLSFYQKKSGILPGNFIPLGKLILKLPVETLRPKLLFLAASTIRQKVDLCQKLFCAMESPLFFKVDKSTTIEGRYRREIKGRCKTESVSRNQFALGSDREGGQNINMFLYIKKIEGSNQIGESAKS